MAPRSLISRRLVLSVVGLAIAVGGLGLTVIALKLAPDADGPVKNRAEVALADWQTVVLTSPRDDAARVGLGLALLDLGRRGEAQVAFEGALTLNKDNWIALYQLGLLFRSSDRARAAQLFEHAANVAPRTNRVAPLLALGDLRLAANNTAGAKQAYEAAVSDLPFAADPHARLGATLERLGDTLAALAQYEEAARYTPDDPDIQRAIARLRAMR